MTWENGYYVDVLTKEEALNKLDEIINSIRKIKKDIEKGKKLIEPVRVCDQFYLRLKGVI